MFVHCLFFSKYCTFNLSQSGVVGNLCIVKDKEKHCLDMTYKIFKIVDYNKNLSIAPSALLWKKDNPTKIYLYDFNQIFINSGNITSKYNLCGNNKNFLNY